MTPGAVSPGLVRDSPLSTNFKSICAGAPVDLEYPALLEALRAPRVFAIDCSIATTRVVSARSGGSRWRR